MAPSVAPAALLVCASLALAQQPPEAGGESVSEVADQAMGALSGFGLPGGVALLLAGVLLLIFGWSLLNQIFYAMAAVVGAACGAFLSGGLADALWPSLSSGGHALALTAGAVLGAAFLGLAGWKARPVAWMLLMLAPFLVISTLLWQTPGRGFRWAVGSLVVGMAAGAVSMWRVRLLAVISTSLMGAVLATAGIGVVVIEIGPGSLLDTWNWSTRAGWPLGVLVVVLACVGGNVQYSLGPSEKKGAPRSEDARRPG